MLLAAGIAAGIVTVGAGVAAERVGATVGATVGAAVGAVIAAVAGAVGAVAAVAIAGAVGGIIAGIVPAAPVGAAALAGADAAAGRVGATVAAAAAVVGAVVGAAGTTVAVAAFDAPHAASKTQHSTSTTGATDGTRIGSTPSPIFSNETNSPEDTCHAPCRMHCRQPVRVRRSPDAARNDTADRGETMHADAATDIVIIGGGVIGCAIAYELAVRGVGVTVVEQREVAASASGASAGGVRQQGRDLRELPLALRAIPRWQGLADRLGADVEYRRGGHLTLIEDEAHLPMLAQAVERQRAAGLDIRLLEPHDLATVMPGVASGVVAGSYTPEDGHANPILTTKAFADAAVRHGATLHEHTAVTGFRHDTTSGAITGVETAAGSIACRIVINATGAWAGVVAAMAGAALPLVPACYQMLVTAPAPPLLEPVVGCVGRALSLKQVPEGGFVIGGGWAGTVHLDTGAPGTIGRHIAGSAAACTGILPLLLHLPLLRAWSGMEGESPDGIPMIGYAPNVGGLFHACGFTGHGFAIAPEVGAAVAEWLSTGTPPYDLSAFDPARFAGGAIPARHLPFGTVDVTRNEPLNTLGMQQRAG